MFIAMNPGKYPAAPAATQKISMRDRPRRTVVVLAVFLVLTVAGCERDRQSGGVSADHEEHAGHVIPADKPRTFPEAVRRLKTLDETIRRGVAKGSAGRPVEDQTLSMAVDIAGWLPEIAAESDMPEGSWQEVDRLSAALVAEYRAMRKAPGGRGDAARARASERNVAALGMVLEKADPHWFDGPAGRSGPP